MARNVSYFKLGLFIIVCCALGIGAAIWLGLSHYFENTKNYVSYFAESVKGLQKDATVNYRGVPIGRVKSIGLAPDGRLVEVIMALNTNFHVDPSLAISLREQGLTGLRYLEINTAPPNLKALTPKIDFTPPYPLIPSVPSEIQQLKSALEGLYTKISSVDVEGLVENWKHTAELLNGVLSQGDVLASLQSLHSATQQLEALMAKVNSAVGERELKNLVASLNKTADRAAVFTDQLARFSTRGEMRGGLKDLSATLVATRKASEALARQLTSLPPNMLKSLATNLESTFEKGNKSFTQLNQQLERSFGLLQQSLHQVNALLGQLTTLVQNLQEQPSRLFFRGKEPNPFGKGR